MYCAIIGDIVGSKGLSDRLLVQERLLSVLSEVNSRYASLMAADFVITLGDEFQGLLHGPDQLLEVIEEIRMALYPVRLRFSIGIGEIATAINRNQAIGADGSAFYAARAGITDMKAIQNAYEKAELTTVFRAYDKVADKGIALEVLDRAMAACTFIEKRWTDKQRKVIGLLKKDHMSQTAIGEALGVSQANVNGRINSSGYMTYRYSIEGVQHLLLERWEALND